MNITKATNFAQENPEVVKDAARQLELILKRSAEDMDFRSQLLENPHEALETFTGQDVPASWNIKFIENQADATIVLPDYQEVGAELSEEELEAVAGGEAVVLATIAASLGLLAAIGYVFAD